MEHPGRPVTSRLRELAELDRNEELALHTATARVAPLVEAAMPTEVLADRLLDPCHLSEDGKGWLAPWKPARRLFDFRLRELAGESVVLKTDVKDCFGSISPSVVESALVGLGCHPAEAAGVGRVLSTLSEKGVRGLPIGPPASTVLANAVLAGVDRRLRGTTYLRWVDDVVVFCADRSEAQRTLSLVRRELSRVGLLIAKEKTSVGALVGGISNPTARLA